MCLAVGVLETLMLKMTRPSFVAPFTSPNRATEHNVIGAVTIRAGVWSGVTVLRDGKNVVQLMSFKRVKTGLFRKKLRDGIL